MTGVVPVTVLLPASNNVIRGCVVNTAPDAVPTDAVEIESLLAAPAEIVTLLDVTAVNAAGVKVNVKAPAVPVITKLVKVATPATAAMVVVPVSVPYPLRSMQQHFQ